MKPESAFGLLFFLIVFQPTSTAPTSNGSDSDARHKEQFQELDLNKDGRLTLPEMVDAIFESLKSIFPSIQNDIPREEFLAMSPDQETEFDNFDTNGDGKLSSSELKAWTRDVLKDQFNDADKNGDSYVTLDESIAYDKARG